MASDSKAEKTDFSREEMGGYLGLELPPVHAPMYRNASNFQSARSAFFSLLGAARPSRVWVPHFICESLLAPIKSLGLDMCFYPITRNLGVADNVELLDGDILVYVNYFGISFRQVEKVLARFNPEQVVLDFSQAFYCPPQECLATFYSPRKFFGLPDGGLLVTSLRVPTPVMQDSQSEERMTHLLRRLGGTAESGYDYYRTAETSLCSLEPKKMSKLTERLLLSIDYQHVRKTRNRNFFTLHRELGNSNKLAINIEDVDGPACYPYYTSDASLRSKLIARRIFIPTYWPEVVERAGSPTFESSLVKRCLPLPCDQRYVDQDMERLAERVIVGE